MMNENKKSRMIHNEKGEALFVLDENGKPARIVTDFAKWFLGFPLEDCSEPIPDGIEPILDSQNPDK